MPGILNPQQFFVPNPPARGPGPTNYVSNIVETCGPAVDWWAGAAQTLSFFPGPTPDATVATADDLLLTSSGGFGISASKAGATVTPFWMELWSQGNAGITSSGSEIPASGQGHFYPAAIPRGRFAAGTWTFNVRLGIGTGGATANVDLHVRAFKYNAGVYTLIAEGTNAGISLASSAGNFAATAAGVAATTFVAGDFLYFDVQLLVNSNTGFIASTNLQFYNTSVVHFDPPAFTLDRQVAYVRPINEPGAAAADSVGRTATYARSVPAETAGPATDTVTHVVAFKRSIIETVATSISRGGIFCYNAFTSAVQGSFGQSGSSNLPASDSGRVASTDALFTHPTVGGISYVMLGVQIYPEPPAAYPGTPVCDWWVPDQNLVEIARYANAKALFRVNASNQDGAPPWMIGGGWGYLSAQVTAGAVKINLGASPPMMPSIGDVLTINACPGRKETGLVVTSINTPNPGDVAFSGGPLAFTHNARTGPNTSDNGYVRWTKVPVAYSPSVAYTYGDVVTMPMTSSGTPAVVVNGETKDNINYVVSQPISSLQNSDIAHFLAQPVIERIDFPDGTMMICPWDPVALSYRTAFIAAFGARYTGNPLIAGVEMAAQGYIGEWNLNSSAFSDQQLTALWLYHGYTNWRYTNCIKSFVTAFANAFPGDRLQAADLDEPFGTFAFPTSPVARTDAGCTTTSGSATIANTAVQATDIGGMITGAGIPDHTYVGTITPGVGHLLSSSQFTQTNVNAYSSSGAGLASLTYNTNKAVHAGCSTNTTLSVTDASITLADQGKRVTGTNMPAAATYVGLVGVASSGGAGTYDLSSSPMEQLNVAATGTGSGISLTYSWENFAYAGTGDRVVKYMAGSNLGGSLTNNVYGGSPSSVIGWFGLNFPFRIEIQQNGFVGINGDLSLQAVVDGTAVSTSTLTSAGNHIPTGAIPGGLVTGTNIPPDTYLVSGTAGSAVMSHASTGTASNVKVLLATSGVSVSDATTAGATTVMTSATNLFNTTHIPGGLVSGTNVQAGTYIVSGTAGSIVLSLPTVGTASNVKVNSPGDRNHLQNGRYRQLISGANDPIDNAILKLGGGGYQAHNGANTPEQVIMNMIQTGIDDNVPYLEMYANDLGPSTDLATALVGLGGVGVVDRVVRTVAYTRGITEPLSASTGVPTRTVAYARSVPAETAGPATDTPTRVVAYVRSIPAETAGPATDSVSKVLGRVRNPIETVGAALDSVGRTVAYIRNPSETVGAGVDSVGRTVAYIRSVAAETAGPATDVVTTGNNKVRNPIETVGAAVDSVTRTVAYIRGPIETVGAAVDTPTRTTAFIRGPTESLTAAIDSISRAVAYVRGPIETVGAATDSVTRTATYARTPIETVGAAADAVTHVVAFARTLTESGAAATDSVSRTVAYIRGRAETVGPAADSVVGIYTPAGHYVQNITETCGPTNDAVSRTVAFIRSRAETVGPATDSVVHVVSFTRLIAETVAISEAPSRTVAYRRGFSEAVGPARDTIVGQTNQAASVGAVDTALFSVGAVDRALFAVGAVDVAVDSVGAADRIPST